MQGDSADYRPIERRLRPLLPANTESTGTSPEAKEDRSSEAHRRVTVACDTCRRRKVKCDGGRPQCSYCSNRRISCVYATDDQGESHNQALRRKLEELGKSFSVYKDIYEHLQSRPLEEAEEILRRIRNGETPGSILEHVQDSDLLLGLATDPDTGQ
ncbi:hypothetical protein MGN70_007901 [Eutypa lata]|nr:hypothetical protein MGN70_007901 [Eutypa lata]